MARKEARLFTSVWDDEQFIAAHELEQRAYFFLVSQPDLEHSGVLPLRPRRWARKGPSLSAEDWERHLEGLERRRFVVVDRDTEEVLVRSLIRRDMVFKEPNVMRSAAKHVPMIESKAILLALAAEMHRIRLENPDLTKGQDQALSDMQSALAERVGPYEPPGAENPTGHPAVDPPSKGSANPSANPSPKPPEIPSAKPSWGEGSVTEVSTDSPIPVLPAIPPPAGGASRSPGNRSALFDAPSGAETPAPNAGQLVAYWLEKCRQRPPGKVVGHMSKEIKNLLAENIDPEFIKQALDDFLTKDLNPGNLPSLVNSAMNRRPRDSPARPGLVEHQGLLLKPETVANLERRKRFEAMDAAAEAANGTAAIEGPR